MELELVIVYFFHYSLKEVILLPVLKCNLTLDFFVYIPELFVYTVHSCILMTYFMLIVVVI